MFAQRRVHHDVFLIDCLCNVPTSSFTFCVILHSREVLGQADLKTVARHYESAPHYQPLIHLGARFQSLNSSWTSRGVNRYLRVRQSSSRPSLCMRKSPRLAAFTRIVSAPKLSSTNVTFQCKLHSLCRVNDSRHSYSLVSEYIKATDV